jgi:hypothetical protein
MTTKEKIKAYVEIHVLLGQLIREATENDPLGGIPAGHMYARLMDKMTLEDFEAVISRLVDTGLIRRMPSHLLVWIGN